MVDYTVNKISIMGKELKLKIPTNEEPNFDLAVVYDLGTESGEFLSCPFPDKRNWTIQDLRGSIKNIENFEAHIVQRRKEMVDNYLVPELQVDNYTLDDHGKKVKTEELDDDDSSDEAQISDNDTSDSDTDSDDIDSDDASQKQKVLAHLENDPKAKTLFQENLADAVEVQQVAPQFVKVTKTGYLPTLLKIGSTFFKSC